MNIARILGGRRLSGSVTVSGSKNACLPILAAALLTEEECVFHNIPDLVDVTTMIDIIRSLGASVDRIDDHSVKIQAAKINHEAPIHLVRKMRGSVYMMGALIGRLGQAVVPVPGGCLIGERPIDLHIKGFESLGCKIFLSDNVLKITADDIHAAYIHLVGKHGSTMGGTINVIMAAIRANGRTEISDAALEPEVAEVCKLLCEMGAKIEGIGTSKITIFGGHKLHGCEYTIMGDRIEAGTLICAGLITNSNISIFGLPIGVIDTVIAILQASGANVRQLTDGTIVVSSGNKIMGTNTSTSPYPGFPTDLQAQFCALMTQANGESLITEKVFPDRFLYIPELNKMGAEIKHNHGNVAIPGHRKLNGSHTFATDLRASAALYLAGLCADGETIVHDIHHLDRGYENFEKKLESLGASIWRE